MKPLKESINSFGPWYKRHPYFLLAGILTAITILVMVCVVVRQPSPQASPEELACRDSAALHVALIPVHDCLPFYVALRCGIYDSLGLDLRILTFQAQLDTDTALLHHRAEVAYSDLARAIMIQQTDTFDVRAIAACEGTLQLITAHRGRVRQIKQLKERMVAIARHSITDYWSDRLMDTASMAQTDIFRPQINDVRIRTDMLCNGTMDAALLPEPYALEALLRGNRKNFSTQGLTPRLSAFIVPTWVVRDSSRLRQISLLIDGYQQACKQLNCQQTDSLIMLLRTHCLIPDSIVDTLCAALPRFAPLYAPRKEDADAALQWLRQRGKIRKNYTADSLLFHISLPDTTLWTSKRSEK